jgi:hypothetical protein
MAKDLSGVVKKISSSLLLGHLCWTHPVSRNMSKGINMEKRLLSSEYRLRMGVSNLNDDTFLMNTMRDFLCDILRFIEDHK